jgi:hypothetical protein
MTKNFAIKSADIKPLATRRGSCYATDRITVNGEPVGFMYREDRDNDGDSGWRFLADDESEECASDPANVGIYDVNTSELRPRYYPAFGCSGRIRLFS